MDWPGTPEVSTTEPVWPGTPEPTAADTVPLEASAPSATSSQAWPGTAEGDQTTPRAVEPSGVIGTFASEAARAAIGLPGEVLKGVGVGLGQFGDGPIEQGSVYRTGKAIQKYADTWGAGEASVAANPIAAGAGGVVGGLAGAIPALGAAALAAPEAAATAAVLGTGAGLFGASSAGQTFDEALLKGADENTASQAAGLSALVGGGLGVLPLGTVLAPVRAYAPGLTGWAAQTLEKAVRAGVVFAGVGEAQEFLGRQIAKEFYDPNAGYSPDVNRVLGSLIGGGIIGTLTPRALHRERTAPVTDATITKPLASGLPDERQPNAMEFNIAPIEQPTTGNLAQTIEGQPGANIGRLATLLGPKLYGEPTSLTTVSVKEMVQNAFDAIKGLPPDEIPKGRLKVDLDSNTREITVSDNGTGMTPEVLANQFLQIAGTEKLTTQASGGLGIAKMLFLYGNSDISVQTMRDGKIASLTTSGPKLMQALNDPAARPKIDIHTLSDFDEHNRALIKSTFPQGHGTIVRVKVPESFRDTSTGEIKAIPFSKSLWEHPVLERSPLLHPIEVTLNGKTLPIGQSFPAKEHTQFANVPFDWGTAHIYVGKKTDSGFGENLHVLSNGLWQFSGHLKENPLDPYGDNIKRQFYIDVSPSVQADQPGYPFDLNRQRFSKQAQDDFGKIFNYISKLYKHMDFQGESKSFGNVQYFDSSGKLTPSVDISPKIPEGEITAAGRISEGDQIAVHDGKLIVNGRIIPELTKKDLEANNIDFSKLQIPQESIDPTRVMLHNNVEVLTRDSNEYVNLADLARHRWGPRFDTFIHQVGKVFLDLRDAVVEGMPSDYKGLLKEAIGISFDETYRGVSIRVPFHGSFLNPARPEYTDPHRAALAYYGTMLHELAHFRVRSHNAEFPAEMQRLMINTESRREEFVQRLTETTLEHAEVIHGLNEILDTGRPKNVGNRFKDSSEYQERPTDSSSGVAGTSSARGATELFARSRQSTEPPKRKSHAERVQAETTGIARGPDESKGFTGYHGSGAVFDKVDPAKVGTGEGNAAFGHGEIYLAENPAVGRDYAHRMSGYYVEGKPFDATIPSNQAAVLMRIYGSKEAALEHADASAARSTLGPAFQKAAAIDKAAGDFLRSDAPIPVIEHRGYFYAMEVTRPKDHFLDWDAPLEQQSAYVQKVLKNSKNEHIQNALSHKGDTSGQGIYEKIASTLRADGASDAESRIQASKMLSEAGVAGNRYPDAMSRGLPEGEPRTYNAVVYDANDVKVTHRNGQLISPEVQQAIHDVQKGVPVEDSHGRAIINGHTVDNISASELNSFAPSDGAVPVPDTSRTNGYRINERAMNAAGVTDFPETPITEASTVIRGMAKKLFNGKPPDGIEAAAAGVDHFFEKTKWLWDLRALTDANSHIEPLVRYTMTQDHMNILATQWAVRAEDTLRTSWKLREVEKQNLYRFVDDYINMRYLKPEERAKGVVRMPTSEELTEMRKQHGVTERAKTVFERMLLDLDSFGKSLFEVERMKALDLAPKEMKKTLERLDAQEKSYTARPYFPATRYGLYTIAISSPEGPRFYRTETAAQQKKLATQLNRTLKPDESMRLGKLPQSSLPFTGLPKPLLDVVERQFLSHVTGAEELRTALNYLKYETSPLRAISSKLGNKSLTPGYSQDFFRNFAHFFFHGGRYLSRSKHVDDLKVAMKDLEESAATVPDGVKRAEIAAFVKEHYEKMLDPRGDWAATRAFLFHMVLGFRVASAATNLTQTLISTVPHLAAEFGDVKTIRATTKAAATIQNFYKRASVLEMSEPEMRALGELMQAGRIRGALAPELAATSEGRSFLGGYGGSRANAYWTQFLKLSSAMFEATEQMNRRVAGMATYDLAMREPTNKFVQKAVEHDTQFYAELLNKGFSEREAAAVVSAKAMIDRTQFQYSKEYRPAYMSGPIGSTIFIFKNFTHRMLWNLYNYPSAAMRSLLIMGFLGGLQGIPGFQDLNGILKAAALNFFGKDFDLEDEARKFAVELLGMKGTGILDDPFTITKGFASRGYGIPALIDTIGEWSGVGKLPIPELDRTAAVGLNNILPVDFGVLFGPQAHRDPATAFAQSVSRGMGALGSYGYNVYKAMMNVRDPSGLDSFKRWEKVAPVFLANMSHAARVWKEGAETGQKGSAVVRFDPHDTEHMMEVIAMGLGYTPFRLSREWTRIRAEQEAVAFWDMRREMLLNQYWSAARTNDKEDRERVIHSIRKFNEQVKGTEARGKAITGDTLQKSMQSRFTAQAKQESGTPLSRGDVPIVRGIRKLFPGAEIDTRRTR